MAYKITEKRKKEIVNVIAEITARLIKVDDVECITWSTSKDENLFTNFLDIISGNGFANHVTKTGNFLWFHVITKEREKSPELKLALTEIRDDFNNPALYKQTGVDIDIQTSPSYRYRLFSDEDKAMISKLYTMMYEKNPDRHAVIKFLNEEVYKGTKVIDEYSKTNQGPVRLLIYTALDDVYKHHEKARFMYHTNIVYDKTPDNYYVKVINQFEGYKDYYERETNPPKELYSLALDLDIEEEVKLRLEKEQ